jgi:hypothetical protein
VKDHRAACNFILQTEERGIRCLKRLEQDHCKVTGSVLRCLEPMTVKEDFDTIASLMTDMKSKTTIAKLRENVNDILMERWWRWILCHPQLGEDYIHTTRSVPSSELSPSPRSHWVLNEPPLLSL